jgi:hypothetical protein
MAIEAAWFKQPCCLMIAQLDLGLCIMPKMRKKSDLPTKLCAVCGLPFAWRKKWARDWVNVSFCSDRCRSTKGLT